MFFTNLYIPKLSFVIFNPHAEHVVLKFSWEYPTPSVSRKAVVDLVNSNYMSQTIKGKYLRTDRLRVHCVHSIDLCVSLVAASNG